jgi:hypothetical protein
MRSVLLSRLTCFGGWSTRSLASSSMTYVAARRVEPAKLMVTSTRETLTQIALVCGLADQSHFKRSFRRVVGMSPALWRRASTSDPANSKSEILMELLRSECNPVRLRYTGKCYLEACARVCGGPVNYTRAQNAEVDSAG